MNDINLITDFFIYFSTLHLTLYICLTKKNMGSKEDFNKSLVNIFLQYRMLTGFFAIFPYITLLIINN